MAPDIQRWQRPGKRACVMDLQDRRVKRTQNLLTNALIALTLEKGYEAVTIRDITQRADVAYATFFRHYHDKDALLYDVLDVVLEELVALLQPSAPGADPATIGTLLFQYVRDHSEVCRVLLSTHGSGALIQRTIEEGTRHVLEEHPPLPDGAVPADIASYHLVASSIELIRWWLEHDMRYSPERMGMVYRDLIYSPTIAVAFTA